jgi:hypothetical protein
VADPSRRLALSRLLAGVDVHPTSLPPSAVLLVRRLSDPSPQTLNAHDPAVLAPAGWTRALQRAVNRAARDAARPAHGPVPSSADAVLFLDPAELLACLARDYLIGGVSANWWWQAWLRATGRSTLDLVLDAWSREPRSIPAAMTDLQRQALAIPFVRGLSVAQALTILAAAVDAYECPPLVAALHPVDDRTRPARHDSRVVTGADRRESDGLDVQATPVRARSMATAPWEPLLPSAGIPASLPIAHRALLGVTLALRQAPMIVRTRAFERRLRAWVRDAQVRTDLRRGDDAVSPSGDESRGVVPAPPPAGAVPAADSDPAAAATGIARAPHDDAVQQELGIPPVVSLAREPVARGGDDRETAGGVTAARAAEPPPIVDGVASDASSQDLRPRFVETAAPSRDEARVPPPPARPREDVVAETAATITRSVEETLRRRLQVNAVVTEIGGVLFLVNVLEDLRFFDRVDDHFRIASPIGAWGWLEIVTRCLFGSAHTAAAADPIWDVLADLDGRPRGVPLTPAARVPRQLKLPATWPAAPRLPRIRVQPLGFDPPPDLRRFLDLVVPYVRWRLRQALDVHERRESSLASRLFHRRGRLEWTATHVDLHMDMSGIDIAVRLAGLDVNPGWVPALGRVVTFHFD